VGTRHRHCIVPANNRYDYNYLEGMLYGTVNHEFSLTSTPASITQFGASMDKPLTDIRYNEATGTTSFHFRGGSGFESLQLTNDDLQLKIKHDLQGRPLQGAQDGIYLWHGKKYFVR
jgi:hypothetical protein